MRRARTTLILAGALATAFAAAAPRRVALAAPDGEAEAPVPAAAQDPATEYKSLQEAYRKAQQNWYAEQRRASEEAAKAAKEAAARGEKPQAIPAMSMTGGPALDFVPKFAEFAARCKDAPQAVDALLFVVQNGAAAADPAQAKAALATLLERHVDNPKIQSLMLTLGRLAALVDDPAAVQRDVAARSKCDDVRAAATFGPVYGKIGMDSRATPEEQAAARVVYEQVAKDFPETRWGRSAAGALNELDHLQVGMVAPEIEGVGPDGKPIKLSDFRGKVVLLDYWGYW